MAKLTVDLLGTDKLNTLVLLLNKYKDEIPAELAGEIKSLIKDDAFCFSGNDINMMMYKIDYNFGVEQSLEGEFKCIVDGEAISEAITSVNLYLKSFKTNKKINGRIDVVDGAFVYNQYYPKTFEIIYRDVKVLGWINND